MTTTPNQASAPTFGASPKSLSRRAFVAAGLASAALAGAGHLARAEEGSEQVVIYHTNDTHGYLQGDGESVVGIDYVAGLKQATPNSLLVDAGDATQGAPLASLTKGSAPIDLMNAAGYDAMCLGNHEFDFGLDNLVANVEAAEFPVLGANVALGDAPLLDGVANAQGVTGNGCNAVLECAGKRIGVFGLTTQATAWSASPLAVGEATFADEIEVAELQIAELAGQGVDAIVALCHLGDGPVPCSSHDLAEGLSTDAAEMLTAIIDGHSHTVENEEVNGILIVQTGCNLGAVGMLTLAFAPDGSVQATEELLDPAAVVAQAQADQAVSQDLEAIAAEQDEMLAEQLCVNPTTLWGGWLGEEQLIAPTRIVETNYGDFVCECYINQTSAFLAQAGLDDGTPLLAVSNGGGIRAAMPRGIVTMRDLVTAFPYSNTLQVKRITPQILKSMFEGSFATMNGQDTQTGMLLQEEISGGFLQLAGFEVTCDPNAPVGQRVTDIYVHGLASSVDLDDDQTPLYLVSNSYVMAGGDAYEMLADVEMVGEVGGELEAIEAYVRELSEGIGSGFGLRCMPLIPQTKGRLILDGGYEPADWTATLRLVDGQSTPLAGTEALLDIDASRCERVTSDADGLVRVEVSDGPHSIALLPADSQAASIYEVLADADGNGESVGFSVAIPKEMTPLMISDANGVASSSAAPDASAASESSGPAEVAARSGYEVATSGNATYLAVLRALGAEVSEAYVDNYVGLGLIEDAVRTYPQLVVE